METQQFSGCMRKSVHGRTNLFIDAPGTTFKELCCSAYSYTRRVTASKFHPHVGNSADTCPPGMLCWHCCHTFDTSTALRLPRMYEVAEGVFHVYGWFCSASCGKAYILEHATFDRGYQMNIFIKMLREVHGITDNVTEAPPRIALRPFGGVFDIETFRSMHNLCHVITPPFVTYSMLIEERMPAEAADRALESGSTSNNGTLARGSVRGLRRPKTGASSRLDHNQICDAPSTGMYDDFLERMGEATDAAATGAATAATATRAANGRVKQTKESGETSGLARFAKVAHGAPPQASDGV